MAPAAAAAPLGSNTFGNTCYTQANKQGPWWAGSRLDTQRSCLHDSLRGWGDLCVSKEAPRCRAGRRESRGNENE